jgi:P27 family predicted phage terminase small subunit
MSGTRRNRPTPTRLKVLRGNPGKRPLTRREARPQPHPVEPPERLSRGGLEHWRELAPTLIRLGLLSEVDGEAFVLLCNTLAELNEARANLKIYGTVLTTKHGMMFLSPHYKVAREAAALACKLFAEFGLTPSARSRIDVDVPRESDALEAFLVKSRRA